MSLQRPQHGHSTGQGHGSRRVKGQTGIGQRSTRKRGNPSRGDLGAGDCSIMMTISLVDLFSFKFQIGNTQLVKVMGHDVSKVKLESANDPQKAREAEPGRPRRRRLLDHDDD